MIYCFLQLRYLISWQAIPLWKPTWRTNPRTPVTVIVPARNEANNIAKCLQSIAAQNYPKPLFEIILVDDHSEDETIKVAEALEIHNLRILRLENFILPNQNINAYKKKAIETGILQAKGDLIVCTDADCRVGEDWLRQIVSCYEKTDAKFILGPVLFENEKGLFQKFQSLDFLGMMLITGAGIEGKFLYMCNGANLAYPKAVFEKVGGFKGLDGIASGDDVLLLQKIAAKYPKGIRFLKTNRAAVLTEPMQSLKDFIRQRRRWASKSGAYRGWTTQFQLGLLWLFHLSMLTSLVLVPFLGWKLLLLWFLQFGIKAMADSILLYEATKFFQRHDLMRVFFPSLFLHWWYIVWVGFLGMLPKKYIWKGRRVK